MRKSRLDAKLVKALKNTPGPDGNAVSDLTRFLELADTLEIRNADVEGLRHILRERSVPRHTRLFYTMWIRGPFVRREAALLKAGAYYIALAFTSVGKPYLTIRDSVQQALPDRWRLEDGVIDSAWECEVAAMIGKSVPYKLQLNTRVLIEGTGTFARIVNEFVTPQPMPFRSRPRRDRPNS